MSLGGCVSGILQCCSEWSIAFESDFVSHQLKGFGLAELWALTFELKSLKSLKVLADLFIKTNINHKTTKHTKESNAKKVKF